MDRGFGLGFALPGNLSSLEAFPGDYIPAASPTPAFYPFLPLFGEDYFLGNQQQQLPQNSSSNYSDAQLKIPKTEPFFNHEDNNCNYADNAPYLNQQKPSTLPFDLFSTAAKRPRLDKLSENGAVSAASLKAMQRRKSVSEKTRSLQKLMPWNSKMNTATMLEEAYKYVRFLQAQIKVLQTIPYSSSFESSRSSSDDVVVRGGEFGALGMLNRNQVLQVLLNSGVCQTKLYSNGLCVCSIEQLAFLKKVAERKAAALQLQQLHHHPMNM